MEIQQIFNPLSAPFFNTTNLSLATALIASLVIFFITKNKSIDKNYRNIFSMLGFFVVVMAIGSAIFGFFFGEKIGDLKIKNDHFITAYGKIPFNSIKTIQIVREKSNNTMLAPSVGESTPKKLLILGKNGEQYRFSSEHYPIESMIQPMRIAWEKDQKDDL